MGADLYKKIASVYTLVLSLLNLKNEVIIIIIIMHSCYRSMGLDDLLIAIVTNAQKGVNILDTEHDLYLVLDEIRLDWALWDALCDIPRLKDNISQGYFVETRARQLARAIRFVKDWLGR